MWDGKPARYDQMDVGSSGIVLRCQNEYGPNIGFKAIIPSIANEMIMEPAAQKTAHADLKNTLKNCRL